MSIEDEVRAIIAPLAWRLDMPVTTAENVDKAVAALMGLMESLNAEIARLQEESRQWEKASLVAIIAERDALKLNQELPEMEWPLETQIEAVRYVAEYGGILESALEAALETLHWVQSRKEGK